jgi:hypothetical protein
MESYKIDKGMLEKIKALGLPERKENSAYCILHVHGDNKRAPQTFNVKVYTGKKGLKLVTNDYHTLMSLLDRKENKKHYDRIIYIDDSGFGMPIGGTLVGLYDSKTKKTYTAEIDVKFYQSPLFEEKRYLDEAADVALHLLDALAPDKTQTLIKICTGFVNLKIKERLRGLGFDVEVAEIGEPLQSELERQHKHYIQEKFGYSHYYDPKAISNVTSEFDKVIAWIHEKPKERLKFSKTGWDYFKKHNIYI